MDADLLQKLRAQTEALKAEDEKPVAIKTDVKSQLVRLLDYGMVTIQVDTYNDGVELPQEMLDHDDYVVLNISYAFAEHDLKISDRWLSITLTFQGTVFPVSIPLEAIVAVKSALVGETFFFGDFEPFNDIPPKGA
jgi:stringent starvation protein B